MIYKVAFNKEIHVAQGFKSYEELLNFMRNSFKSLPENYQVCYEDAEGDKITIACDEDIKVLEECQAPKKMVKLFIEPLENHEPPIVRNDEDIFLVQKNSEP